ncbi:V-type proton ATPase subunit S1 [Frankliniella occidentalis]|uniref:V-type proton ATPase subunit S1 n=1 Tax=Frankliniella occidentalis TaxID=133901 RepID=A0A6J1RYQ2_FRAOC|nr:V-type proton ATPase subunit S1 [Frankliniella occidentalis]
MKMASFKMYLTAILACILGTIFSTNAHSHVPVLLWQSHNGAESELNPPALSRMNVEEFADVLMRRVEADHNPVVVLFVEDTLSIEDFSRQSSGRSSLFPALQTIKGDVKLEFIPSVQTPVKALNRLSKLGYKWEQINGEVLPEANKKILIVNLSDLKVKEDRPSMLLQHDKYMTSLYKRMVTVYPNILAVYTGRHSSWTAPESRVRRDVEPTSSPATSCNVILTSSGTADQIMLYTSECPVLTINNTSFNLTSGEALSPDTRKESQRMILRYKLGNSSDKVTVRFRFNFTDDGYWQLTQAEYENSNAQKYLLEPKSTIRAALNNSYNCGSVALFQNTDKSQGNVTLWLKNIKVQPSVQGGKFSASEDCVPYFTIPIWSGLFVTFLLLFIVAWGIDMMMSIHTMDRFDDPKGKPLVFNAQE